MVGKFFCEDIHWLPNCVVVNYRKLYDTLNRNILQALTYTNENDKCMFHRKIKLHKSLKRMKRKLICVVHSGNILIMLSATNC